MREGPATHAVMISTGAIYAERLLEIKESSIPHRSSSKPISLPKVRLHSCTLQTLRAPINSIMEVGKSPDPRISAEAFVLLAACWGQGLAARRTRELKVSSAKIFERASTLMASRCSSTSYTRHVICSTHPQHAASTLLRALPCLPRGDA